MGIVASALTYGGLMGSIVAYRRGETPGLALFWQQAGQHWPRLLGLTLLLIVSSCGLVLVLALFGLVMTVVAFVHSVPVLGRIVCLGVCIRPP